MFVIPQLAESSIPAFAGGCLLKTIIAHAIVLAGQMPTGRHALVRAPTRSLVRL